ncbi:MAG: hypothetical protein HY736_21235 [Verrucomicrobia bacterium]|nr:hypothetical protein [Verrucomicrobiota bacterium]
MKLISGVLLIALTALPAFGQQSTREDFKEFCQAMAGRWLGDVTWIMDWPGFGKRGDKVTAYAENKIAEDGHALHLRFFGGPGSGSSMAVYDAGAKQIRWSGGDSGGTTFVSIVSKQNGKWASAETGSHADGTKYEGKYTVTISDGGNTHTWAGSTKITGKKADELKDVWRRVSK